MFEVTNHYAMESFLSKPINYVKPSKSNGAIFKFTTHLTHKNLVDAICMENQSTVLTVMAQNCLTTAASVIVG